MVWLDAEDNAMTTPLFRTIPPLKHGDQLTRDEFERRYDAMPDLHRAELIDGVVYIPPLIAHDGSIGNPSHLQEEGQPHAHLVALLGMYRDCTPGIRVADNTSVRLDPQNEPQPEAVMFIEQGG